MSQQLQENPSYGRTTVEVEQVQPTLPIVNNQEILKKSNQKPENEFITIQRGTILYHGSIEKANFNPFELKLSEQNLVAFFTPSIAIASDMTMGCSVYSDKGGFIHKFQVMKDIPNIVSRNIYERNNFSDLNFVVRTCVPNSGVAFKLGENDADMEVAICRPKEYLKYISTQRCIAPRTYSQGYQFMNQKHGEEYERYTSEVFGDQGEKQYVSNYSLNSGEEDN